jgi:prevent-host-death family protein
LGCWYTPFRFCGRTLDAPDRSGYSSHVKIATITQAKNQLSALIDRVRHGETVVITDRGRPVARLESVVTDPSADPAGRLARLERRGLLRRGGAPPARTLRPFARGARASGALDLLLEERRSGR